MKQVAWIFSGFSWQVHILDGNSAGRVQVAKACGAGLVRVRSLLVRGGERKKN